MRNPTDRLTPPTRVRWWLIRLAFYNPGVEIPIGLLARLADCDTDAVRRAVAPLVKRGHVLARCPIMHKYWRPKDMAHKAMHNAIADIVTDREVRHAD